MTATRSLELRKSGADDSDAASYRGKRSESEFQTGRFSFSAEIVRKRYERLPPSPRARATYSARCSAPFKTGAILRCGSPKAAATGVSGELRDCYKDMTRPASRPRRDRPVSVGWVQPTGRKPLPGGGLRFAPPTLHDVLQIQHSRRRQERGGQRPSLKPARVRSCSHECGQGSRGYHRPASNFVWEILSPGIG